MFWRCRNEDRNMKHATSIDHEYLAFDDLTMHANMTSNLRCMFVLNGDSITSWLTQKPLSLWVLRM